MKDPKKVKMGKASRAAGGRFERKTRTDLERQNWIVSRWGNNVEFPDSNINLPPEERIGKLVPSKSTRFRSNTHGFPDFCIHRKEGHYYDVVGIEVKSNGYLKQIEKEKIEWLLENKIFSRIYIASKGEKRGSIEYKELNTMKTLDNRS